MRLTVLIRFLPLLCGLVFAGGARAQNLTRALELARENEPTYRAARANFVASQEKSRQAFAGLLPQVTASANSNANHRDYITRNSSVAPAQDTFNSNNRQVNLTQPIWRHANLINWRQAESLQAQAEFQRNAAEQDLLAKLLAAWCDTMLSRDVVLFTERQMAATRQQWDILRRGVEFGTASIPAREDARAKYEQALAEKITAESDLEVKNAVLEQIVGPLRTFNPPFLPARLLREHDLSRDSLTVWLDNVESNNPAVIAATRAVEAAEDEIGKQRAGHEPTLDAVASYTYNSQSVGNFPGQAGYEIRQGAVGVQLAIPIYAGGGQNAKVREAIAVRERVRQDLEAARRAARLNAKQAWFSWQGASARRAAAVHAIRAATLALRAASVAENTGLKTDLEILQARQQLESSRRDLNRARYDMITAVFKLKAAAGQLTDVDVVSLDKVLSEREADMLDALEQG